MTARKLLVASRGRHKDRFERGAAAVEMALVLPLLLFLLMGMIDFGRAFNGQIRLSAAAREGVRLASLNPASNTTLALQKGDTTYGDEQIRLRVMAAGGPSGLSVVSHDSTPLVCPATPTANSVCIIYCPTDATAAATASATVVVTSQFSWITGISGISKFFGSGAFPTPTTLQSSGVMRCAG